MITFSVKDYSDEVLRDFDRQVNIGLKAVGQRAEGYAKEECPVAEGRLRDSISNKVQDKDVYIGTNVEYAPYVEYGDYQHKVGNKHFLKNAAANHSEEYKNIVETSLKA